MDRLRALAFFCKVVETESITEAARAMSVSKAVVSKYVAALERELGVRLFHRTTRSVRPTATGRAVFAHARSVLERMQELEGAATAEKGEPVGTLRVSAPVAFGTLQLAAPLSDYARAHPKVQLELALTDRFVRLADEGFDVGVRISSRIEDEDLVAVRLATTSMIACASPDYIERAGRPRKPQDLARHACLAFASPTSSGRVPWKFGASRKSAGGAEDAVWIDPAVRVDSSLLQRDLACAGLGIAFLLPFVAEKELRTGSLVPLLEGFATEERSIHAVYPSPQHASAKVRTFVRALRDAYRIASWNSEKRPSERQRPPGR
ncbi:Transcriptional regulator, LysR family [Labilithrix luteola]|uniref:Transcriptional regulator, LysR family n=1 Tax=Labilithrix luteola TaxID=1391654 RepID=A0A0K1PYR1_9BACT|nr:LysR family transcriptional regulator [Labilithrix luteola]AKU98637.1 Transcriptional regulator, LysR family [Labilithrix luteola]